MKKLLFLLPGLFFVVSCSETLNPENSENMEVVTYDTEEVTGEDAHVYPYAAGEEFDQSNAITSDDMAQIVADFDGVRKTVTFTSEITENCEKKGCWMMVAAGDEKIRVSFKDYDFFVPLDSKGHHTTLNGDLFYDTLTVDELRHYAMDANASQDSINSISEPVLTLSYEATGVYVD